MNFQAVRRAGLDADPGIDENSRYAGVTFAQLLPNREREVFRIPLASCSLDKYFY